MKLTLKNMIITHRSHYLAYTGIRFGNSKVLQNINRLNTLHWQVVHVLKNGVFTFTMVGECRNICLSMGSLEKNEP